VFREGNSLLKVGVPVRASAIMFAAAVVRTTAGSEFGRAVAEMVASRSVRGALHPFPVLEM
jgi:hypothetical protein